MRITEMMKAFPTARATADSNIIYEKGRGDLTGKVTQGITPSQLHSLRFLHIFTAVPASAARLATFSDLFHRVHDLFPALGLFL